MAAAPSAEKRVGSTSLTLPAFGFGSAHLGELYAKVDEADSRATLEAAWDAGVRFYDTAPWYGRGLSEHRLGGFLRTKPRDQFKITTKVGRQLVRPKDPTTFDRSPWVGGLNFEVLWDYSYDGVMRSLEASRARMGIDRFDALHIHDPDWFPEEALDSAYRALDELKRAGVIGAIGVGVNQWPILVDFARRADFACTATATGRGPSCSPGSRLTRPVASTSRHPRSAQLPSPVSATTCPLASATVGCPLQSTVRACRRPARTSQTIDCPFCCLTASAGMRMRGADAFSDTPAGGSGSMKSTRAPISGRMRGSRSVMATFTCTVARCRSAVGTTWRTAPRKLVSG